MFNSPLGKCRETVFTLARVSSKNTVRLASEDAKIGVVQMVYLPLHLPDEEPPPYMSRCPKSWQVVEDW